MSSVLSRSIKNGSKYNAIIPKPPGQRVYLGDGDTHFSVKKMIEYVLAYNFQVAELAKELQNEIGENATLAETCNHIHDWLYWHLQYKQDGLDQDLRSPAHAWHYERTTGVDCKSYSIFASCILLQLGIKHYIRKIKQPTFSPENFTHVYVIVPEDQTTGSLKKGYYTIDGTIITTTEPSYIEKKDFFMDKMPHYGLNGLHGDTSQVVSQISNLFKDFSFDNLFNSIDCWGGTAFDSDYLKRVIPQITDYALSLIDKYNNAIAQQQWQNVHKIYIEYWVKTDALEQVFVAKKSEGWNSCSEANLQFIIDFIENKIRNVLGVALTEHIKYFFNFPTDGGYLTFKWDTRSGDVFDGFPMEGAYTSWYVWQSGNVPYRNSVVDVEPIQQFVLTTELESALNSDVSSSSFSIQNFLSTLIKTAPVIYSTAVQAAEVVTGNSSDSSSSQQVYENENKKDDTTTMGPDLIMGGILLTVGAAYAFSKMKDNPKNKNNVK